MDLARLHRRQLVLLARPGQIGEEVRPAREVLTIEAPIEQAKQNPRNYGAVPWPPSRGEKPPTPAPKRASRRGGGAASQRPHPGRGERSTSALSPRRSPPTPTRPQPPCRRPQARSRSGRSPRPDRPRGEVTSKRQQRRSPTATNASRRGNSEPAQGMAARTEWVSLSVLQTDNAPRVRDGYISLGTSRAPAGMADTSRRSDCRGNVIARARPCTPIPPW